MKVKYTKNQSKLKRSIAILAAFIGLGFATQLQAGYHGYYGYGHHGYGHHGYGYGYGYYPYSSFGHGYHGYGHSGYYGGFYRPYRDYSLAPATFGKSSGAWRHLAKGNIDIAKRKFAKLAARSPTSGLPRVGLSLSAALSGKHEEAVIAMRNAFELDPTGASDLPSGRALKGKLCHLVSHYRETVNDDSSDVDSKFMLAALSYFLRDSETAIAAVQSAIDEGDGSKSARNLKMLLG